MGVGKSQFSEEELQDYQDLTYFTKKEVMFAHQKFKALAPEKVGHNRNAKLPMAKILQYPELRVNPFGDRICKVFSSSQDGDCTFEDFLDMMSVFSDAAPKAVKAEHAFRIFDFDGDDMLGVGDLRQVIDRLTAPQRLNESDMQQLLQCLLDEADLDDDGALSFAEFEHIIEKSSDFSKYGCNGVFKTMNRAIECLEILTNLVLFSLFVQSGHFAYVYNEQEDFFKQQNAQIGQRKTENRL